MYIRVKLETQWLVLSVFIGVIFTLLLLPNFLLHPSNLDILLREGDAIQNFLGFAFFRQSYWGWPITYTHDLFYPLGTSIVFTDSYPILSILLKLFSFVLPKFFIPFGVVAILNSGLMFYSASLFFRTTRHDWILGIIGGLFALISTIFIWRFNGHFSLTTQWLIIFNLLLIIKPSFNLKTDTLLQLLLIFVSCGTHPYLSAMIVVLSFGLAWKISKQKLLNTIITFPIFLGFILFALFSAWFFGWFSTSFSGVAYGGSYQ